MEALQYIYTSWKNGNSTEKGYMIYSRSEGITEAECTAIKDAMQYLAPKELTPNPDPEEIEKVFPYSFAYFLLPTGRGCVAQSTYLGKDYSGRYGNYIIYAMVFDPEELPCRPAAFFGEPYIKTAMTEEELDAPSPVPPLPPLRVSQYATVINDEQLTEFLYDKEEEFAQVIQMVLSARDRGVPFYLNDTRENLVLWAAAVQRILPPRICDKFTFNTYIGDHEAMRSPRIREEGLNFHMIGVRPDANYFNYAAECRSNRHLVLDFLGGHMTQGYTPSAYARAMACSLAMDYEEVDIFGVFLHERTRFDQISCRLQDAYLCYQLTGNGDLEINEETVKAIISFAVEFCPDADNSELAGRLLSRIQEAEWIPPLPVLKDLWKYTYKYADYMKYTLFELVQETVYQNSGDATAPCVEVDNLIKDLKEETPDQYQDYLNHMNSATSVDQLLLYLSGHRNVHTNSFYIRWILRDFSLPEGLSGRQPIVKLLRSLLNNVCRMQDSEKLMVNILFSTASNRILFESVLQAFLVVVQEPSRLEQLCQEYAGESARLSDKQVNRFEQMLLDTPGAGPIATRLCARKIAASKEPDAEFWRFYDHQKGRIGAEGGVSIDPMVSACLGSLNGKQREDTALDMVRDLDLSLVEDPAVIRQLTDLVNACPVKTLAKLGRAALKNLCQFRGRSGYAGIEKIRAVYVGEALSENLAQRKRPVSLSGEIGKMGISLADFERSDYDAYEKNYCGDFLTIVRSGDDVTALMRIFWNPRLFGGFVSGYISGIKKLERKDPEKWENRVVWTCVCLVTAPAGEESAEALYKPMIRYLRSLEDEELARVRKELVKLVPGSRCEPLFEEVQRKEGFSEKIGGFFHRK